jgi:hypothetical protein
MDRRKFLLTVGAATTTGCIGSENAVSVDDFDSPDTPTPDTGPVRTPAPNPKTEAGDFTVGQTYRTPEGVILSILDLGVVEGEDQNSQAGLAYAYAENQTGSTTSVPGYFRWSMLAGNRQYDPEFTDDERAYEGGEIVDGVVREGWVVHPLPSGLESEELTAVWSGTVPDGEVGYRDVTVKWSW